MGGPCLLDCKVTTADRGIFEFIRGAINSLLTVPDVPEFMPDAERAHGELLEFARIRAAQAVGIDVRRCAHVGQKATISPQFDFFVRGGETPPPS
ncbi:hypothetical protein HY087_00030 [Candidatus Gottesmanbacteria bacterium]|nr:hypothetical protein [Candidatus Gottesmanbacteria bacterium]